MVIAQPTTAAQIFHLLRRQMVGRTRKPLVVFSPKSLLRNKAATSPMQDLSEGKFKEIIGETEDLDRSSVSRILLCTGKVYYELAKRRQELAAYNVAIVRIEQLYPFNQLELNSQFEKYPNVSEVVWVQDEPQNQGAWSYIQQRILAAMNVGCRLGYAGRPSSSSPAVGYASKHIEQLKTLLSDAFGPLKGLIQIK